MYCILKMRQTKGLIGQALGTNSKKKGIGLDKIICPLAKEINPQREKKHIAKFHRHFTYTPRSLKSKKRTSESKKSR